MKTLLLILSFLISLLAIAQKQGNVWYFGDQAGLDFNNGSPIAITNGQTYNESVQNHSEGTSVICDSSGTLLFYTNGEKIWNSNHQIMPNGDSLLGHLSSTQTLIVPKPGNSQLFYVFTTDAFFQSNLENGLRYSVVDICLDNGYGDVLSNMKNILLVDTVAEKLTAVRHSNGIDYWIITHKYNSDAFHSYLLSNTGVSDTVITHIGSIHQDYCPLTTFPTKAALGQLKASPGGSKIVCVNGQGCNNISELFDFNKATGVVSNTLNLYTDSLAIGLYGASFSPDNSKLYISSSINNDNVYQYDLSSGTPSTIVNSKTIVASHNGGPWFMGMQLGPDGKIYIAIRNQNSIAVINNPNVAGTNCNLIDGAVSLNGKFCSLGLPNILDSYDYTNTAFKCETHIYENNSTKKLSIYPNPSSHNFNIRFDNPENNNFTLFLYNSQGELVKTIKNITSNEVLIKRNKLANDLFFVQLISNRNIVISGKIILK